MRDLGAELADKSSFLFLAVTSASPGGAEASRHEPPIRRRGLRRRRIKTAPIALIEEACRSSSSCPPCAVLHDKVSPISRRLPAGAHHRHRRGR